MSSVVDLLFHILALAGLMAIVISIILIWQTGRRDHK